MYVCAGQAVQVRNERDVAQMMRVLGLEERRQAWRRIGTSTCSLSHSLSLYSLPLSPCLCLCLCLSVSADFRAAADGEEERWDSSSSSSDGILWATLT